MIHRLVRQKKRPKGLKEFTIQFTVHNCDEVTLFAKNEKEARKMVHEIYDDGDYLYIDDIQENK